MRSAERTDDAARRQRARDTLDRASLPIDLPYTRESWPIAAAMLQFAAFAPDGKPVVAAGPDYWRTCLGQVRDLGFDSIEIPSAWLPTSELSPRQLSDLHEILDSLSLRLVATSVVRRSVIDAELGTQNLAMTHRAVDAAAALGAPVLCLGLHAALLPDQQEVTWFWTRPGAEIPDDPRKLELAVHRFREVADHAREVGVQISLEMYEDTYLATVESSVRFIEAIDRPNVGLNPDIGNLIRQQRPVESWEVITVGTLPLANYWHVKNYMRLEAPSEGIFLTAPTTLVAGIIDYRKAVKYALSVGFCGAFVVEHYGGDGLGAGAQNRDYLRSILPDRGPRV
jgi:sugar phosphate isomerase/epimerase